MIYFVRHPAHSLPTSLSFLEDVADMWSRGMSYDLLPSNLIQSISTTSLNTSAQLKPHHQPTKQPSL